MSSQYRTILRAFLGLSVAFAATLPLCAQLDPRLQSSKTDFMDLYQQSSSLKAKPEIVTVFDYSRSMDTLMFHPLYRNDDLQDADDYRSIKFVLTPQAGGGAGPAANHTYLITARAGNCNAAWAQYKITTTATGAIGVSNGTAGQQCNPTADTPANNLAPSYTLYAQSTGNTNAYAWVTFSPTSTGANPNYSMTSNGNQGIKGSAPYFYTMTHADGSMAPAPTIECSATTNVAKGTVITLTSYMTHPYVEGDPYSKNIQWSGGPGGAVWTQVTSSLFKSVATWTVPGFTPTALIPGSPGDPTELWPITVTGSPTWVGAPRSLTFTTYFKKQGTGANNNKINWTVSTGNSPGTNQAETPVTWATAPIQTTATTLSGGNVTWTYPAYNNTSGAGPGITPAYVTATLDASPSPVYNYSSIFGWANLGTLSSRTDTLNYEALRKPDGTKVTSADAIAASGSLWGTSSGVNDVRNWVRAASHVRFKSGSRTIDIPIPWKIMDRTSTGSPLTSTTVFDRQTKITYDSLGTPISTDYGSGTNIEMDQTYKVNGALGTFTTDVAGTATTNGATGTVILYTTVYRPAYVAWLFYGKYHNNSAIPAPPALQTLPAPNYTTDASIIGKYVVFDAMANNLAGGQGTNTSWGKAFGPSGTWGNMQVPQYNADGTYRTTIADEASKYAIPTLTRMQATKRAALQTWIAHQADVFWAFRCLDPTTEAAAGTATNISNNSTITVNAADATTTHVPGNDSGWKVLNNTTAQGITSTNGNSVTGMNRIASMFAKGETPITYGMARALAQYNDLNSVFNAVIGTDVSQCANSYLLLFTDGVDNNGSGTNNPNTGTPYITGSGATAALNAAAGNQAILADKTSIDRTGSYWNIFTMAGVAAHLSDPSFGTAGTDYMPAPTPVSATGSPSTFLPFAIKQRNGVTYNKDHRVTIMTVGVSLGGQYTDTSSPKRSLFLAAVAGDPSIKLGLLNTFHTFNGWDQPNGVPVDPNNDWVPDPQDPSGYPVTGVRKTGAVFFFDATDPDKLKTSMDYAFRIALGISGNNTTASPNLPFTGASLGKQVYLGTFNPPTNGGAVWPGDLMMFGTLETKGVISIIDQIGNPAATVDKTTAQWATSTALASKLWTSRTLYTRLPGNATNPERGLHLFTDVGTDYANADAIDNTAGLKNYVGIPTVAAGSAAQKTLIQYVAGGNLADLDVSGRPKSNRLNIMGDVIDSAPAPLEYKWSDVVGSLGSYPRLSAVVAAGGNRFRIILVGTNQGWLHAFGEVTRTTTVTDTLGKNHDIVTGDVEELWAFMPTDFLANLNYLTVTNNPHRFLMNGTPAIYFLDLPPATGGLGNGVVDISNPKEKAIAVVGLRKGGRSYYALNIKNPFSPTLQWSLVPDEADNLASSRAGLTNGPSLATAKSILRNWGFSTATPAFGRVRFGSVNEAGGNLHDAVFLGGGSSVPEVEANFGGAKLGRSVMAVDVWSGAILAATDLTDAALGGSTVGPVGAGVIPFEFILNSGMAQRAYFLDYTGGLWSWGSTDVATTDPYKDFRIDTSELSNWKVRKVYQDSNSAGALGGRYSTVPAPYRVGSFPGVGKTGSSTPAAVGIVMVSGDRNNPLDFQYGPGNPAPNHHRLTVVFDRQDSRAWGLDAAGGYDTGITDSDLANFTGNNVSSTPANACSDGLFQLITPGCPTYYLAPYTPGSPPSPTTPKFGYYLNFPSIANNFIPKGINPPMVVSGSLFYSYFTPATADPCTGGSGNTYSWFTTDVMNPIVDDTRTGFVPTSGKKDTWAGVASDYIALGTKGVLQGGTVPKANPVAGAALVTTEIHTTMGPGSNRYPKVRVWRTVH
jgi:hypothetical protein